MRLPPLPWTLALMALSACLRGPGGRPTLPPPEPKPLRLIFGGDVNLGRGVEARLRAGEAGDPLAGVADRLRGADAAFVNLECALGPRGSKPLFHKPYNLLGSTDSVRFLSLAGVDVAGLANNHVLDYGPWVLATTIAALDRAAIARFGAGMNLAEARQPAFLTVGGGTVAFLGYGIAHSTAYYAGASAAGIAPLRLALARKDIAAARNRAGLVIASLHWGMEYTGSPSADQRRKARALVDAGARLVIGHHPHVPQGLEVYKDGLIAYSLGNLLFDQRRAKMNDGFLLEVEVASGTLGVVRALPLAREAPYWPLLASGEERSKKLKALDAASLPLGTRVGSDGIVSGAMTGGKPTGPTLRGRGANAAQ